MTAPSGSNEVPLILDTDLGNDCDDAGALAVLHALADLGEARILAVGCQKQDEWGAPAVDAINTYYGRPDVPVGQRAGIIPGSAKKERLRYTEHIAKSFPNKLKNGRRAPEVTALYRQVLAAQPDHSVVFCAIGPLSNLKSLLESAPDERSSERPGAPTGRRRNCRVGQLCNSVPAGLLDGFGGEFREVTSLSGRDLVARKVKMLVLQGGLFPSGMSWNLQQDPPAAQTVADDWPTPVV
ncbi:MAG: hypothetical protein FJ272_13235, partial [Planctomycetes bacterium]|nr:hypothetical protein [Planctomycetota bacterium]